jgi:tight adherence protein C
VVPVSAAIAWGIVCGLGLGLGLWSLLSLAPRMSGPRLIHRVAPYVVDVSESARDLLARRPPDPLPVLGTLVGAPLARLRDALAPFLGGTATIELRLRQAGPDLDVEGLRARQLASAVGGAAVGVVVAVGLARANPLPILVHVVVVILCAVGGFFAPDLLLQRAARARMERMSGELPVVLEFLTLSLGAGEGILDSLRRVATTSGGELAGEFARVVADVNSGESLGASLGGLAARIRMPALSRCIEQVVGALERGTPLAEVLRAQAQDAREESKRELIELAGKKEVAMMIPLVFLILPVTILFAVFPGIFVLQLGF